MAGYVQPSQQTFQSPGRTAQWLPVALFTVLIVLLANSGFALTGDIDNDCNVDRDDLNILMADRNKSVADSACREPCDLDGDGVITVLDARKLVLLCTQPRCANMPDSCTGGENLPPAANAGTNQTVTLEHGQENILITLDGSGSTDDDGDIISYVWDGTPDPADEMISEIPLTPGEYVFTLAVTDDDSATDTDTVSITILEPENIPPVADAGSDQLITLAQGQESINLILNGKGSDQDGSVTAYTWTGSPDPDDIQSPTITLSTGTYVFSLTVVDDDGTASVPDTVQIVVEAAAMTEQHQPQISVDPQEVSVNEGDSVTIIVNGTDPDNEPVSIAASPRLENAEFTAVPGLSASGTFTFSPDFDQQGIYVVAFTARDPFGNSITETAQISVNNVNRPPTLTVPESVNVDEGGLLTIPVTANDPDGDVLTVTAEPLPQGAIFIPATGTITFAPNFEQAGNYTITCTADDGSLSTTSDVAITVNDETGGGETNGLKLNVDDPENPTLKSTSRITGTVNMEGSPVQSIETSLITGLVPASGKQGETIDVTLQGQSSGDFITHFIDGVSQVNFGEGVTVNTVTVNSETELTTNITIDPDAPTGTRAITVTSGNEISVSMLAFTVTRGTSSIIGTLIDPDSGQPIAGAVVTLQGTNLTATTDQNGHFSIDNVPIGSYELIINAVDHQLITVETSTATGQTSNVGEVSAQSTVFDPQAPAGASLHSLLARFALQDKGQLTMEEAKSLVRDTVIFAGGDEIGALDEYGNQLNPKVSGDGLISLPDYYVESYAERLVLGRSARLMDILYGLSFAFDWIKGEPPTLKEWISAIQSIVDTAWQYPYDLDSRLPILLFNTSNALTAEPPQISSAMHLNDLKAFLFFTSFLTGHEMFNVEGVGAPFGIGNNPVGATELVATTQLLASTVEAAFSSPAAHDSPGDPSNFSYYLSENFDNTVTDFMNVYLSGGMLAAQVPQLTEAYNVESRLKGTLTKQFGYLVGEKFLESICAPPFLQEAVVFDQGTPYQSVGIRFKRSNTDPGAPFDDSVGSGTFGNRRYSYQLYRQQYLRGGVTLVPVADKPWYTDNPDSLLLIDPNPPVGVNHYRVVFLHGDINLDFRQLFVQQDLSSAQLLRWAGHVIGTGTGDTNDVPLGSYSSFLHKSTSFISRLSQDSISIAVPDAIVSEENPVVDLVVHPASGAIYLGDREYDEIVEIDPLHTNERRLVAQTGFALPGQAGLAITPSGAIYTDNSASDHGYGGRIFRFSGSGGKEYAGQVNYFSELLGKANPVSVISLESDALGNIYVADNYDKQVKKISMTQAIDEGWPTNRIVGKGIGAEVPAGFSSFSDITIVGDDFFLSSGSTIYKWLAAGQAMTTYSEIPQAHFAGLATDTHNQLYIACQGIDTVGGETGFIMVVPEHTAFSSDSVAAKYKFFHNLTYPGEVEISADGKAIIYTEGGRAKAEYFGISGQLVDDHGQLLAAAGDAIFVKAYSDLGESQWHQADENGNFSIMGLLAPAQNFHGNTSKQITLAIKSGGYTEERIVTLQAQGQTLLDVTHNSYEIVIDPGTINAAPGTIYPITYQVIDRGTHQDVTADVFSQGMIEVSVGDPAIAQVSNATAGEFSIESLAEPGSNGTFAAVALKDPSTGITLSYSTVSLYHQQYTMDIKSSPCSVTTDPSGAPIYECSDVPVEITLARGRTKDFAAEVFDTTGDRITDLDALAAAGYTIEFFSTSSIPAAPELTLTTLSAGGVIVEIPVSAREGYSYQIQWKMIRTSDNTVIAQSNVVTIYVRDFSISNEIILDNDPPGIGETVTYVIKVTNYSEDSISGGFFNIISDVLDIVSASSNVIVSGNTVANTLEIEGDHEELISIGCTVNSTDYDSVVSTASFTHDGTTKSDSAIFGAKTSLKRTEPGVMRVRGVSKGWLYDNRTCPVVLKCQEESCDESNPVKTIEISASRNNRVTLFGLTEFPFEVEIAEGTNSDNVTFTSKVEIVENGTTVTVIDNPSQISFFEPVVLIEKTGSIGRGKTTVIVDNLWENEDVKQRLYLINSNTNNIEYHLTINAITESHHQASYEMQIIDNFKIINDIVLNHSVLRGHDSSLVDYGNALANKTNEFEATTSFNDVFADVFVELNYAGIGTTDACTTYQQQILAILNDLRGRDLFLDTLWLFNGIDYTPIQTNGGYFDERGGLYACTQYDARHQAVAIYPSGKFKTPESRVLDPWRHQMPISWEYNNWENYYFDYSDLPPNIVRDLITGEKKYVPPPYTTTVDVPYVYEDEDYHPAASEKFLRNFPDTPWFDNSKGYPHWSEVKNTISRTDLGGDVAAWYHPDRTSSMLLRYPTILLLSPLSFVLTDKYGYRYGQDDQGNVFREIPGIYNDILDFPEDSGHKGYKIHRVLPEYNLTLYPKEDGIASLIAMRVLPDDSAVLDIYGGFPIDIGHPISYSLTSDNIAAPALEYDNGSHFETEATVAVLTVVETSPTPSGYTNQQYPVITAKLSQPVSVEKMAESQISLIHNNGSKVLLSIEYDLPSQTVFATPHEPLQANSNYQVRLLIPQAKIFPEFEGIKEDFKFIWNFFTGDMLSEEGGEQ